MADKRDTETLITKSADVIRNAEALLVCAGAGIGVDSGLPDFRGNVGFWKAYPPLAKNEKVTVNESSMRARKPLPACPTCNATARPNILMFGDWSWLGGRTEDQYQRYGKWLQENRDSQVAIVECGAGSGVPTVRMTSERIGASANVTLIRINICDVKVK
jgi:NAD-dependent SIR2 family protein deacetylase